MTATVHFGHPIITLNVRIDFKHMYPKNDLSSFTLFSFFLGLTKVREGLMSTLRGLDFKVDVMND